MDVHDLSALLQMQNQTQTLLMQLQNKQLKCRELFNESSNGHSDPSIDDLDTVNQPSYKTLDNKRDADNYTPSHAYKRDKLVQSTLTKTQQIHDALAASTKLSSYRRVTPEGSKPGRRTGFKLAQGIEYSSFHLDNRSNANEFSSRELYEKEREKGIATVQKYDQEDYQDKANTSVTFNEEHELLGSEEKNLSSTPKRLTLAQADTPKSILKRRKIIDDNVKVDSNYVHTPTSGLTPKHSHGLNYSYSEVDDLDLASSLNGFSASHDGKHRYSDATDGSYIEEYLEDDDIVGEQNIINHHKPSHQDDYQDDHDQIDQLIKERLLLDSGNDRKNASLVLDLSQRPKSYVFESANDDTEHQQRVTDHPKKPVSPKAAKSKSSPKPNRPRSSKTVSKACSSNDSKLWRSRDQPLLGYDWIAGVLDNESGISAMPDDYFKEIQDFRRVNRNHCFSKDLPGSKPDLSRPISPEIQDPGHKCLHGFTVNDRLFTEPMNPDDDGLSSCPVCLIPRTEPSKTSPGFVRVSIPRSTLEKPYRVKPHRRRSFDATDSYALSKHCLAGYECSLPTTIPTAKNIDLKGANGIQAKQAMSLKDAEDFVNSHSRSSRLMNSSSSRTAASLTRGSSMDDLLTRGSTTTSLSKRGSTNTSLSKRGSTNSSLSKKGSINTSISKRGHSKSHSQQNTTDLLNVSHSLRYDLQDMARRKGKDQHKAPHSTAYPMF